MALPAHLLWGVKLHKNMLHVIHFDLCFDKSWYRKLSFSYKDNHIIAVPLLYVGNRNGGMAHAPTKKN